MVFSCTKKVLDKLKKYNPIEIDKAEVGLYNWYVDLINLERKNYFLFTNSKTLFSVFAYMGTHKELKNVEERFKETLKDQVEKLIGNNPNYYKSLVPNDNESRFLKTNSRTILGVMNQTKVMLKIYTQKHGSDENSVDIIHYRINTIPMALFKYANNIEVMHKELNSRL